MDNKYVSKMSKAVDIYNEMVNDNKKSCQIIRKFMSELTMTLTCAETYFNIIHNSCHSTKTSV